jgi:hypothetical protein
MTQREHIRALNIGLWTEGPVVARPPGALGFCRNYEVQASGCQRVPGFERFDGQPSPSAAVWYRIPYTGLTANIVAGEVYQLPFDGIWRNMVALHDVSAAAAPSGHVAFGYIDAIPDGELPARPDGNGQIRHGGVPIATIAGIPLLDLAPDAQTEAAWRTTLENWLRQRIERVPGIGPVLMAAAANGVVIAARAANATRAGLYRSGPAGWTPIVLGRTLEFTSGGTYRIQPGNVITGATSGATATVVEVVLQSGGWTSGDAAGYLVLTGQSGTFVAENLDVGANANVATIASNSTPITLSRNGPWFWDVGSVQAGTAESLFFTDGAGFYEYDGTHVIPLRPGSTGTPRHVAVHKNHVFVSYGNSIVHSALGNARDWRAISGASEIATEGRVTGMQSYAKVLVIGTDRTVNVLHGTSSADWSLELLSRSSGMFEQTLKLAGQPVFLDRGGIRTLEATPAFGDFAVNTLSQHVHSIVLAWIRRHEAIVGAMVNRERVVYRLFFDDGKALSMYFGSERAAFGIIDYGIRIACAWSGTSQGRDFHLIGGEDGFVYQADRGRNFDGNAIEARLRTVWDHGAARTRMKRWLRLVLDAETERSGFSVTPLFDYGAEPGAFGTEMFEVLEGSGASWGSFAWGEAVWGRPEFADGVLHLDGRGHAIALLVDSKTAVEAPHTLRGYTIRYVERRLV